MQQYKCMAHLNIASLLPHFRKDVGEGEKIQEMLTKDVECLPYGKQHLGIFNLLSEQDENKGLSTLKWHGESKQKNDCSLSHTVGAKQLQVNGWVTILKLAKTTSYSCEIALGYCRCQKFSCWQWYLDIPLKEHSPGGYCMQKCSSGSGNHCARDCWEEGRPRGWEAAGVGEHGPVALCTRQRRKKCKLWAW